MEYIVVVVAGAAASLLTERNTDEWVQAKRPTGETDKGNP